MTKPDHVLTIISWEKTSIPLEFLIRLIGRGKNTRNEISERNDLKHNIQLNNSFRW